MIKYKLNIIKYYILFMLEFLQLKSPFDNKYIDENKISVFIEDKKIKRIITKIRYFAFNEHLKTNQRYGNKAYFFHLNMVASNALKFYKTERKTHSSL